MDAVYPLHHIRADNRSSDHAKLIGAYRSDEAARSAIGRLRDLLGFRDYRGGWHVDRYPLDKDHWAEGFVDLDRRSD